MAKANLLKTETKSFLDLIGNGKVYRVPPYQRDYSWHEEQWEDLWSDVTALSAKPDDRHYMGALVVEGRSDREFLIIDGQQRIATLSVLALAILGRLHHLVNDGIEADDNRERIRTLRGRFIGEKDPTSLTESSKLFLNVTDNEFYQDYLVQLREPLNPRSLPTSNQALWECFLYFRRNIERNAPLARSGTALSSLLNEAVARQLLFILITVEDDLNAYPSDDKFEADFVELEIATGGQRAKLVRYILCRIESQASGIVRDWLTDPASIEHVFPENPVAGWDAVIPAERQAQAVYRLGNLTLLEKNLNRDAGNRLFDEKKPVYARSGYRLTRAIEEHAPPEWSIAAIEVRQRQLAERAVTVWRSDLAGAAE